LIEGDETIHRPALPPGPWIVKGQTFSGGRGKAGIILKAKNLQQIVDHANTILGSTVHGQRINAIRIEQQVSAAEETYLAFMIDPAAGGVRVIMSARGGVDIETLPSELIKTEIALPEYESLIACVRRLAAAMPSKEAGAMRAAAEMLARIFIDREALLLEINPLFVKFDGRWVVGDVKWVADDNTLFRQPKLRAVLRQRMAAYPATHLKLEHGFDYVVVDPKGEIGLLTTGAGLSMMLIDEMRDAGLKPYNFLDVRTGGLREETSRLVQVLGWIAEGRNVRVLLINIFAGITDLGEFAKLLVAALRKVPQLKVPVVARLLGNGLESAQVTLDEAGIRLFTNLDDALVELQYHLGNSGKSPI
jgi:succinyl-CoA synthetase beta subunit